MLSCPAVVLTGLRPGAVSEGRRTSQRRRPKAVDCLERTVGGIAPFGDVRSVGER